MLAGELLVPYHHQYKPEPIRIPSTQSSSFVARHCSSLLKAKKLIDILGAYLWVDSGESQETVFKTTTYVGVAGAAAYYAWRWYDTRSGELGTRAVSARDHLMESCEIWESALKKLALPLPPFFLPWTLPVSTPTTNETTTNATFPHI